MNIQLLSLIPLLLLFWKIVSSGGESKRGRENHQAHTYHIWILIFALLTTTCTISKSLNASMFMYVVVCECVSTFFSSVWIFAKEQQHTGKLKILFGNLSKKERFLHFESHTCNSYILCSCSVMLVSSCVFLYLSILHLRHAYREKCVQRENFLTIA